MSLRLHRANWEWHPTVRTGAELSAAERIIDAIAAFLGSPTYIIVQTLVIIFWIILNAVCVPGIWMWHWDPRPYILLNLVFSTQAAYAAPIILASQNRTDKKREERAEYDINVGLEILGIVKHIHQRMGE